MGCGWYSLGFNFWKAQEIVLFGTIQSCIQLVMEVLFSEREVARA